MNFRHFLSRNEGIAIVAVTMVLMVAALLGGAIITQSSEDFQLTERSLNEKKVLYFAESAKERAYQEIIAGELDGAGNLNFVEDTGTLSNIPIQGGRYSLTVVDLTPSIGIDDDKIIEIIASGQAGFTDDTDENFVITGRTRVVTVTAQVDRENVCVWNNAVFGGSGYSGGVISGNAAIHGSVHLLGTSVGEGNAAIEALDLTGTSLIHNNYGVVDSTAGISSTLLAKVPALPLDDAGQPTLDAKLRVKNGAVGVSGSSEIGTADALMDGIFIETDPTDTRWTGTAVDDGVPDSNQVFSNNGTNALYDLGDILSMPEIGEPYKGYDTYDEYFSANSLHLGSLVLDGTNSAALAVQSQTFPSLTTVTVNGSQFDVTLKNEDGETIGRIAYNPAAASGKASLLVEGMVQIDGDLSIGTKQLDVDYSGKGTIFANGDASTAGDISVHGDLLPATTFPTGDALGLVARNDMNLATGSGDSQLKMAGAFYAGHQVTSRKQNEIAGTFVCTYFDMGTNVPKIFQVPTLVANLPPGIIGGDPIWVITGFHEKSWRADFPTDGSV